MYSRTSLKLLKSNSISTCLRRYGEVKKSTSLFYSTSRSEDDEDWSQSKNKEEKKLETAQDLFSDLVEEEASEESSADNDTSSPIELRLLDLIERQEEIYKSKGTPGPKFLDKAQRKIPQTALWDVLSNRSGFRSTPRSILPKTLDEDQIESQIAQLQSSKNNLELRSKVAEIFSGEDTPRDSILATTISLARNFGDPYMGYAIYQQVKRKGVVSYVTGCSGRVYNELLINSWDILRDRTKVESFLTEMIKAGIEANPETKRIVSRIISEEAEYGKDVESLRILVQSLELPA
ncbi:hypothetical protein K7432_000723 [Basidiobolus ranarum]|uniref:Mtf2-like C-terminal domain-containing protein n=1 Tax=Basidiobolus ranarum TaxID=34480 RepID=A0ABR2WAR7_9FUNG